MAFPRRPGAPAAGARSLDALDHLLDRQAGAVDHHRILGGPQRRILSRAVDVVATL